MNVFEFLQSFFNILVEWGGTLWDALNVELFTIGDTSVTLIVALPALGGIALLTKLIIKLAL